VGGLVGLNEINSVVTQSTATGSVSGITNVGGLVGNNVQGTISQSIATGTVDGITNVGGLVGNNVQGTISQSTASGTVDGTTNVGSLVGNNDRGIISESHRHRRRQYRNHCRQQLQLFEPLRPGGCPIPQITPPTHPIVSDGSGSQSDKDKKKKCNGAAIAGQINQSGSAVIFSGNRSGC
jgi:hypothetical protein